MAGVTIRSGDAGDLEAVGRIQQASPGLSKWDPADYLEYDLVVAECEGRVTGFIAARAVSADEAEILNLAVEPAARRRGIGRQLVTEIRARYPGAIYLEVRESNQGARRFYQVLGFKEFNLRQSYYSDPLEGAIVMKFHSC